MYYVLAKIFDLYSNYSKETEEYLHKSLKFIQTDI